MRPSITHSQIPLSSYQKQSILLFLLSLAIALVSGIVLYNPVVTGNVSSAIIAVGLDPLRAQLIAALLLTLAAALDRYPAIRPGTRQTTYSLPS